MLVQTDCRDQYRLVIRQGDAPKLRRQLSAVLAFLLCPLVVIVVLSQSDLSADNQRSWVSLLQSKLAVRSATLVVKDLADEWQLSHYEVQPFEFCGKSTLTNRQLKACTDHFLSLMSGDGSMKGLPTVSAFDICMKAQNDYQLKSCIWKVSSSLQPDDFIILQVRKSHHQVISNQKPQARQIFGAPPWRPPRPGVPARPPAANPGLS